MSAPAAPEPLYAAIDLGAGSGRVFLVGLAPGELRLEETRRFQYPPRRADGHLRWDFSLIRNEVTAGLRAAAARAADLGRPLASVGVDSWGVDYGLVDGDGHLVEDPVCYRDERTAHAREIAFARVPPSEIFRRTGIQFLPFNTLFQLVAHAEAGFPPAARALLLIPDLLTHALTGRRVTELTNASTTQLLGADTGTWDDRLIEQLGLPRPLLCDIVAPGTVVAPMASSGAAAGLAGTPLVAVATHDTGSAVAGSPLAPGSAYISSGTWSLVGVELDRPLIDARVEADNFTNERGVGGTFRFLKNVMGLWLLESCRGEWARDGRAVDHATLLRGIDGCGECGVIYPDDPRLLNPPRMLDAIAAQLRETGQRVPETPVEIARLVLDSLALRYATVVRRIRVLTGRPMTELRIVGGGSRNAYLNQATATACELPVFAGPVEATVIGNALVQAMSGGRFADLADARRHVAERVDTTRIDPRPTRAWGDLQRRYAEVEARFASA